MLTAALQKKLVDFKTLEMISPAGTRNVLAGSKNDKVVENNKERKKGAKTQSLRAAEQQVSHNCTATYVNRALLPHSVAAWRRLLRTIAV
eukprot:6179109-Pleurochrysis_carterae.AAC.5